MAGTLNVEIALLSFCLNCDWVYPIAAEIIKNKNYFTTEIHKSIWQAMEKLHSDNDIIDYASVSYIAGFGDAESLEYLTHIDDQTLLRPGLPCPGPTAEKINSYAKILDREFKEKYSVQEFLLAAQDIKNKSKTPENVLNELAAKGFALGTNDKPIYTEEQFHADIINGVDTTGSVFWKIGEMDKQLEPLKPGSILIIGARPSHGKTALMLQLADSFAEQQKRVYFMSTEMGEQILLYRPMARMSGLGIPELEQGLKNNQNWNAPGFQDAVAGAFYDLSANNERLVTEEASGMTGEEIVFRIKIAHRKFGMDIFMLDHFHDISHAGKYDKKKSMEDSLNSIVATCRNIGVTAVIAAQLNRGSERREDSEPNLADLRECGKLEEAATNVLLLYWPFKKHMDTKRQTPFEIICAKSRNGSIGKVYLEFAAKQYFFHGHYTPEEWREANKQGGLR